MVLYRFFLALNICSSNRNGTINNVGSFMKIWIIRSYKNGVGNDATTMDKCLIKTRVCSPHCRYIYKGVVVEYTRIFNTTTRMVYFGGEKRKKNEHCPVVEHSDVLKS